MTLTSFADLAGRRGGGETLSTEMETDLERSLLFFWTLVRAILGENFDTIVSLRDLDLLSIRKESQLA